MFPFSSLTFSNASLATFLTSSSLKGFANSNDFIVWAKLYCLQIYLTPHSFRYPYFSFVNDMLDRPTSLMEFSCNPFTMTFPGEVFSTDNDRRFVEGKGFKQIDSFDKILSLSVRGVSSFSETSKFLSEKMIIQFFPLQEVFEIFSFKNRELTFGETTHIDERLDVVRKEDFYKVFFCSPISSKSIYLFHVSLSYHFFS